MIAVASVPTVRAEVAADEPAALETAVVETVFGGVCVGTPEGLETVPDVAGVDHPDHFGSHDLGTVCLGRKTIHIV